MQEEVVSEDLEYTVLPGERNWEKQEGSVFPRNMDFDNDFERENDPNSGYASKPWKFWECQVQDQKVRDYKIIICKEVLD